MYWEISDAVLTPDVAFEDNDTQFIVYPFPNVHCAAYAGLQVFQHQCDVFCLPRIAHKPSCGIDDCLEPVK